MATAKLNGAVQLHRQTFRPSEGEDALKRLASVATQKEIDKLKEMEAPNGLKLLEGDLKSSNDPAPRTTRPDNTPSGVVQGGKPRSGEEKLLEIEKKGAQQTGTAVNETADGQPAGSEQVIDLQNVTATELAADFPGRMTLISKGFDTVEKVDKASDEELKKTGLTDSTIEQIRKATT